MDDYINIEHLIENINKESLSKLDSKMGILLEIMLRELVKEINIRITKKEVNAD